MVSSTDPDHSTGSAARVAALYDIHANLPALEAVLEDVRKADVDLVVVGGDVVPGPMPRETFAALLSLPIPTVFIRGNGEVAVFSESKPARVPAALWPSLQWVAGQIPDQKPFVQTWDLTVRVRVPGLGVVLFCHATPRNEFDIFTELTRESQLEREFEGVDADVIVCGHTHMTFDRMIGTIRVANAGSIGQSFGQPGAHWLLLGPDVQPRTTFFDKPHAAERIRLSGHPGAEEFVAQYIYSTPSKETMLEQFSRVELGSSIS